MTNLLFPLTHLLSQLCDFDFEFGNERSIWRRIP
jgi:hypothetical protein